MCSNEFSRAAIDSNRIPNSIESLPMNSVNTLLKSESLNNQYLKELLLNRQANLNKDGECQKFLSKNLSDICKKITESSCQFKFFEHDDNVNQYIAIPQFSKFKAFKRHN